MLNLSQTAILVCLFSLGLGFIDRNCAKQSFTGITIDVHGQDYNYLRRSGQIRNKPRNFYLLYQATDELERAVCILDKSKDGKVFLNPTSLTNDESWRIDYGDIPKLYKLTKEQVKLFWGEPIDSTSSYVTYALSSSPPVWYTFVRVIYDPTFFIDAKFNNQYLAAYRIRSPHGYTHWISVESK